MARVGKNIKFLRTAQKMTQDDLAELLFVSRQTVSNYETGKSNPDIDMLVRIADALKTDPNSLIYGVPKPQNRKKELVSLCVAAGILAVLIAAVLIGGPLTKDLLTRYYIAAPWYLTQTLVKPCIFLLVGWVLMQAIFLTFNLKPVQQNPAKWVHRAIIGLIAAYFVIMGPFLVWTVCSGIASYLRLKGDTGSYQSSFDLGPVWNWLTVKLFAFSRHYSPLFMIPGVFLRATKPQYATAKETPSGEI